MEKLTALLAITYLFMHSPVFGQWERRNIDASVAYTCFVDVDDIDSDGDMDVVVSEYGANMIRLYENNYLTWTEHDIGYLDGVVGLDIADFDNDGKLDVAAAAWRADAVVWYKNNGGDPISWTKYTIDNTLDGAEVVFASDIDGDGAVDAVAWGYNSGEAVWYKNNLPAGWTKYNIGSVSGPGNIRIGDINKDGKPDVVTSSANTNRVVLYKNNLPDHNWTEILIDQSMYGTFMANIGDIDNDGDMDVVANAQNATGDNPDVAWYENDGSEQTWTKHTISIDLLKARCQYIVDIDNDGYLDIVVTDLDADDVIIFINEKGGQSWGKYVIDDNYNAPNVMFASDIDLDGDFDVFPSSRATNSFVWYENPYSNAACATSCEISPHYLSKQDKTLEVFSKLKNPENHPAEVWATILDDNGHIIDSLQLFDDGLHKDEKAGDNIWSNTKSLSGLSEEGYFNVILVTHDLILGTEVYYTGSAQLTTIGPVVYDGYTFGSSDTIFDPGESLAIYLNLKNNGTTATAVNISAELISLDTLVTLKGVSKRSFGDIAAGESAVSGNYYRISISDKCPNNSSISFGVEITSDGYKYWSDTFSITVGPTDIEDIAEPVARIYPNPTNDVLNIEINNTGNKFLIIDILDIKGKIIYQNEFTTSGAHYVEQIDLSGYAKGIYLVKVRQADGVYVGKVVVR